MLAGASGSVIIKYVNSSYFWVCTSLSRLSVPDAVFSYGGATTSRRLGFIYDGLCDVERWLYLEL